MRWSLIINWVSLQLLRKKNSSACVCKLKYRVIPNLSKEEPHVGSHSKLHGRLTIKLYIKLRP